MMIESPLSPIDARHAFLLSAVGILTLSTPTSTGRLS